MTNTSTKELTLSRTPNEQALEALEVLTTTVESLKNALYAQFNHANTILVDLRHRVEVLEQKQGMAEPKRTAKVRHAKQ